MEKQIMLSDRKIDNGREFDFGRTSPDYARYRDIYPEVFYQRILDRGLCRGGQTVLDIGTGTGVIPRSMYKYGAKWYGTDISENQIKEARRLSDGMEIDYYAMAAENLVFPENYFDVITACQCYWYLNHEQTAPVLYRLLKPCGRLLLLRMDWLPLEDEIAGASEDLVLKYNPDWSGAKHTMQPISLPECYSGYFDEVYHEEYKLTVPFTRESWHGRMKSCRGIGASLTDNEISAWEEEHIALLNKIAPEEFDVLHYAAMLELKTK